MITTRLLVLDVIVLQRPRKGGQAEATVQEAPINCVKEISLANIGRNIVSAHRIIQNLTPEKRNCTKSEQSAKKRLDLCSLSSKATAL